MNCDYKIFLSLKRCLPWCLVQAKAMVRICPVKVGPGDSMLCCDAQKRQITVSSCGDAPLPSGQDSTAPKSFFFDAVFPEESSLVSSMNISRFTSRLHSAVFLTDIVYKALRLVYRSLCKTICLTALKRL